MADKNDKWPNNTKGRFYVDRTCIACDACIVAAPNNFTMDDDGGHAFVFKQPETPEEMAACVEAMEGCPVDAIGNDGEEDGEK